MKRVLASMLLCAALSAGAAHADPPAESLASRLEAVARSPFASAAEGTVTQARGALERAESLRAEGDEGAAERAEAIARAAIHLAERQVARATEHTERDSASQRLAILRQRLETVLAAIARLRATEHEEDADAEAAAEAAAEGEDEE